MSSSSAHRFPFLLAAALVAAALGDLVVEGVSNTGAFGSGYFDHDHLSVIPVLCAGFALVLEIAVLRLMALLRGGALGARRGLPAGVAGRLSGRMLRRDLPLVLAMQLAAVFAMQSAEQLAAGGATLAGPGWLGGPLAFALTVYAATALVATVALALLARAILAAGTALIRIVLELVVRLADQAARPCFGRRTALACARAQAPHVRQIGGRAPPRFPTPV